MLTNECKPTRSLSEVAPKYVKASRICSGYPNQNKLVDALETLGPEEEDYALVYLDGHIECAYSIVQKQREIQGQYNQIKKTLALEYPQTHILLEVAAKLLHEGYQIKVLFDCNYSLKNPRFVKYIVTKHKNPSSSYITMQYHPFNDYLHIYPDELNHLLN